MSSYCEHSREVGDALAQAEAAARGRQLAAFALADRDRTPTADQFTIARQSLLDWLGVTVRGAAEPVAARARRAADAWGPTYGEASILGTSLTAGMADAAMLNGIAGHVLDYDDTSIASFGGHPSAVLLPALLALAEVRNLPPSRVLNAFCVGVRTGSLLGAWCNPAHYDAGWHATATLGTFAAAAGCASLLELDLEATSAALGLAALHAAGLRVAFGTAGKPIQVGQAAANGLRCALLAAQRAGAPEQALDGPIGFLATHDASADESADDDGLAAIRCKYHACCHSTHAAIEAARALVTAHRLDPTEILDVNVTAARSLIDVCGIDDPQSGLEAKFSLRAGTCLALLGHDTADPDVFTDQLLGDPAYRGLLARIHVSYRRGLGEFQAHVTVGRRGGGRLTWFADVAKPEPAEERWERLRAKFCRLAVPVVGSSRAAEIVHVIADLHELQSVRSLLELCRVTR